MSGQFPLEVMFPKLMAWKFTPNVGVTRQSWHVLSRSEHRVCERIPCDLYEHCCGHRGGLSPTQPKQMKLITPFTSSEKQRRLKFYLIKAEGRGVYAIPGSGCKHEGHERLVCFVCSTKSNQKSSEALGRIRGTARIPGLLLEFLFQEKAGPSACLLLRFAAKKNGKTPKTF